MVAAAIIGAAVIAGGETAYSAHEAGKATNAASATAQQTTTDTLKQQAQLSAPYRAEGELALPQLNSLLGLTPGSDPTKALEATPGYNFAKQQGIESTVNKASAMGMDLSGNTLTALDKFGTGLADQTYQQAVNNAMGVAGMGQAAAAGQAQNVGTAGANSANISLQQGTNLGNLDLATAANYSGIANNAINQGIELNTLNSINSGLKSPTTTLV